MKLSIFLLFFLILSNSSFGQSTFTFFDMREVPKRRGHYKHRLAVEGCFKILKQIKFENRLNITLFVKKHTKPFLENINQFRKDIIHGHLLDHYEYFKSESLSTEDLIGFYDKSLSEHWELILQDNDLTNHFKRNTEFYHLIKNLMDGNINKQQLDDLKKRLFHFSLLSTQQNDPDGYYVQMYPIGIAPKDRTKSPYQKEFARDCLFQTLNELSMGTAAELSHNRYKLKKKGFDILSGYKGVRGFYRRLHDANKDLNESLQRLINRRNKILESSDS